MNNVYGALTEQVIEGIKAKHGDKLKVTQIGCHYFTVHLKEHFSVVECYKLEEYLQSILMEVIEDMNVDLLFYDYYQGGITYEVIEW